MVETLYCIFANKLEHQKVKATILGDVHIFETYEELVAYVKDNFTGWLLTAVEQDEPLRNVDGIYTFADDWAEGCLFFEIV